MTSSIPEALYASTAPIVFFPVRHHSPACARLVRDLILQLRPAAVLIEGPSDFNPQMYELALDHRLPIAIYSYTQTDTLLVSPEANSSDEASPQPPAMPKIPKRMGAFYPFCEYSPEWVALQTAREVDAQSRFIDLPWYVMLTVEMAARQATQGKTEDLPQHRYADAELRRSPYIPLLCRELGVETFDEVWDTLFEIEPPEIDEYLKRAHHFMASLRLSEPRIRAVDIAREAYMAEQIKAAQDEFDGAILVVTGGFHSLALYEQIYNDNPTPLSPPRKQGGELPPPPAERGIALTPYSYERLDNLRGYESGMPNPGFYHHMWHNQGYRGLLGQVATRLREHGQSVSTADLIAVETSALALAALRGHARVWRRDVIDGVITGLVKDELAFNVGGHPFLNAVYEVFRGNARGQLAAGTTLPPLVVEIQELLATHGLQPETAARVVDFDLALPDGLERSRLLHKLRVLHLPGFMRVMAADITAERVNERWEIIWSPEFEAACIEAAVYGATLEDAARTRLLEDAEQMQQPNAAQAAALLTDAALMGLPDSAAEFYQRLAAIIMNDGSFFTTTAALADLLFLYRFDAILGTSQHTDVGHVLKITFHRALLMLEMLGAVKGQDKALLDGIQALTESYERCTALLGIDRADFAAVFERIAADNSQTPLARGAATGVIWTVGAAQIDLQGFAEPEQLGDFLTGLFYLAREVVQRDPDLIARIDTLLLRYDEEGFFAALPSLRLAFSFFLPREKFYLTRQLFGTDADTLPPLEVDVNQAVRVLTFEDALYKAMEKYGILI